MAKFKYVQGTLSLDDYEELSKIAEREGKSIKEIISESIRMWLIQKRIKKDDSLFQTEALFEGSEDMSTNHDDIY